MSILSMQQTIEQTVANEQRREELFNYFNSQPSLLRHSALQIMPLSNAQQLVKFVEQYIQHVPVFMLAINELAKECLIEQYLEPILKVAESFFQQPPIQHQEHEGLTLLLDEAYLAHRLFEEINDIYVKYSGHPLLPLDTTQANIFVHSLIGEPFANELDDAVKQSIESLNEQHLFEQNEQFILHIEQVAAHKLKQTWQGWPCFMQSTTSASM